MSPARAGLVLVFAVGCGDPDLATSSDSTGEPTSSSTTTEPTPTTDPTTSDDTEDPPPVCAPDGPGGVLEWERRGDELPGFITAIATNPAADTIIVGTIEHPDAATDSYIQLYNAKGEPLWSDIHVGPRGLEDRPLAVAVDGAGFIHVLVQERVLEVLGFYFEAIDERLVILRYAPDGRRMWRWEREHEPVEFDGNTRYEPTGRLGIAGDRIVLLELAHDEPIVRIELDPTGNLLSEAILAAPDTLTIDEHALGPDGAAYLAGHLDDGNGGHPLWFGRFAADGSVAWSETFVSEKPEWARLLFAGRDGEVYLVHNRDSDGILRRHDADGTLAWTTVLPLETGFSNGALHCDGSPLLGGSVKRVLEGWEGRNLWAARFQADNTPAWTFEQEFDLPVIESSANHVAGAPNGDVLVAGSYRFGEVYLPWLGRLSGG